MPITISSSYPSGTPTQGIGFQVISSTATGYNIWDNNVPQNSARLYPASAANATKDIVMLGHATSTSANPSRVKISFGSAVINPTLIFFSIDSSTLDFSPARTAEGAAAPVSFTTNTGLVTGKAITRNPAVTGGSNDEGCESNSRRACGVVQFWGTYNELSFDLLGEDGVGFQLGTGVAPAQPGQTTAVPSLSGAGLAATILSMVGLGAWFARRRRGHG